MDADKQRVNIMTKETLAELLNGREYGSEITDKESSEAKRNGLVVVFGASDDLMEFRGAIDDEVGCYDGGTAWIDQKGILPEKDQVEDNDDDLLDYLTRKKSNKLKSINADWCIDKVYSWTFRTSIPHASFEIKEDGDNYCRGIVFDMKDL